MSTKRIKELNDVLEFEFKNEKYEDITWIHRSYVNTIRNLKSNEIEDNLVTLIILSRNRRITRP